MTITSRTGWLHETFAGLIKQMRWSYLPPLMVYLAYGISGLTSIVGTFFVKLGASKSIMGALYKGFIAPLALYAVLGTVISRNQRKERLEAEAHEREMAAAGHEEMN